MVAHKEIEIQSMKNYIRFIYKDLCIAICAMLALLVGSQSIDAFSVDSYTTKSKLAEGKWVKIKVSDSGVFTISKSDLSKWGFGDITKVKIYGYGGAPISETLNASQLDDIKQVPVYVANDEIYFYAQGPTTWVSGSPKITYKQYQHPYSTAGYYFLTDSEGDTQQAISSVKAPASDATNAITQFTERIFYEKELVSLGETGHYLLGEDFKYNTSRSFKFALTDYVQGSNLQVLTAFAAKSIGGSSSSLKFQYNGTNLASSSSDLISATTSVEYTVAMTTETVKTFAMNTDDLTYTINFSYNGTLYAANLDYITINYPRKLKLYNGKLSFNISSMVSPGAVWKLDDATDKTHVWDISATGNPIEMVGTLSGNSLMFTETKQRKTGDYIAFDENANLPSPEYAGTVSNQNIHGEAIPDMIIITPSEYRAQAQRVADLHAQVDSMRVLVLEQDRIFNEFSSGNPDMMGIRKMCKMFYDRGKDAEGHKLGYLLFFGRGTYDNRELTAPVKALDYPKLLTWQSPTGTDQIYSYSTDDIFVMLEDGSGSSTTISSDILSIAVGRMPVKSVEEAKTVVDKLCSYVKKSDFGAWKNNVLMIADDGNNGIHMKQAQDVISNNQTYGGSNFVMNRLYLDAFTEQSLGSGRTFQRHAKCSSKSWMREFWYWILLDTQAV